MFPYHVLLRLELTRSWWKTKVLLPSFSAPIQQINKQSWETVSFGFFLPLILHFSYQTVPFQMLFIYVVHYVSVWSCFDHVAQGPFSYLPSLSLCFSLMRWRFDVRPLWHILWLPSFPLPSYAKSQDFEVAAVHFLCYLNAFACSV